MVRPARAGEAAALAEVAAATFPLACPPAMTAEDIGDYVAEHLSEEHFAQYLADPARSLLVLEEGTGSGGRLTGYSMLIHTPPADPEVLAALTVRPSSMLSKFYVRPDAHGSGLAHRLLAATFDTAASTGARAVWLSVNDENLRAQKFYAKNGFRTVGRMDFPTARLVLRDFVLERIL
ncbi:putative acetyltransferase [Arthrobacter crystallopoietes BAB-32]|uniref:Putative acetyltransferase n=1 Tax=Arthrobacter crystallopoietes BAB-32 TaxID=1246476 RepID=N1UQ34_9MICC|nr:putative acetyltransferase [Arthrobacter crystallopoietes BAB-32]